MRAIKRLFASNPSGPRSPLNSSQIYLLTQHIPAAQLTLFNEVLLVSLGLLYGWMASQGDLFDCKFQQLLQLLQQFKRSPEFTSGSVSQRSRNNAILAFAFYRVLFWQVPVESDDPWVLLKRIPPQFAAHLGAQQWRLYELKAALFDELTTLQLNQDIQAALQTLCPQTQQGDVAVVPENTTTSELTFDAQKLAAFVRKKLSRQDPSYAVNRGGKCFANGRVYGAKTLFINEQVLADYAQMSGKSVDDIQHAMVAQGVVSAQCYDVTMHNQQQPVWRLQDGFDFAAGMPAAIGEIV